MTTKKDSPWAFDTRVVRGGVEPDPATGAIITPIYQNSTFVQPKVDEDTGYTYTRTANPSVAAQEKHLGN